MPDFRSIYDAYRQAETPLSLKEFSRLGNYLSGDDSFAPADLNGFQETVKKGSYWFDKALEATGAPQASADLFGSVFKSLGGSEEAGREVGASLPRTAVEWAPAIAGGPVGIGSRLGLAIAGAAGAAGAYEKTDSGASAATAGAMPFVGSALGSTAASALAKAAGWTPEMLAGSASKRIVQYIASQAGALGGMEAINAVESGQAPDYTSKDYWLKLAASQLPFAVFDAKRVLAKPELPVPPVEPPKAPGEPTPTEVPISPESAKVEIAAPTIDFPEAKLEAKEKISISRKEALAEAEAIDNPVDKQKAIEGINKSHDELAQAIDLGTKPKEEVTKVEEEKKSKANYTSWDSEAAANRFAESIKGKYDVNVIPDEATGKFNVEYSKKAEVEKLPTMPEVDPNAAPEQAVKVLTEVDKKEEVNKQIVELVAKGETPARAVEIATNKVLGEATEVPVETPAKAKNKGGRPSTTKEVEALFTRLMSDTPGTPRDAEFAKAMKDHKVAEVVQDNSKAQTNSQANKGYRVLRNAYDAWTNGVDWGGIKMDGKPASEVMSAIKSRIKAEMKRTITAGSKPYVEHVTGEDPVGEAKEALAEESKVALETEDEEEAPVAVKEDNSPDDLQEGDKDNLARSKGDSLDPDQVAAEQSDAIGSALSFGHRLEVEGLLDDQATRIAWANHVFAMKAKAKTPEAKKLVETRLEALAKLLKVERKDIGPALRDYWFKQNEEWEARGNSGAILRPAGGGFEYALDEYDPVKNRLGKHTLPKDGWITEGQLKVMGQKQRLMKDHEIELYKVIVPEAFKDGKVNVPVLDKGLQNNLATEVHTYGQELARFNRGGRSPLAGLETKLEGVAATFDSLFYRVARKSGLHDKETAAILPSFKKMLEVAGMKDVEYGELISDSLVGGKDIKGMATTMGEKTRRMWLAALGGKDKVDWSRSMMALIAHENGHLVDQLYNTNQLMGARAKQAYEKMLKWKDTASPEELKATMKQAAEMLLPEKWQQLPELKEMLDVADGTEALATLHGIFSLSEGVKRFDAEIGSALLPAGPRGFLRTLAEYGSSFVKLLKNMLHIGGKPDKVKLFESLQENYKELQHGVKQASENLYNLQKLMSYNPADMSQVKLSTLEALQTAENPDSVKQMARFLAVEPKDKEDSQLLNAPVGMIHQAARGMSYLLEPLDSLTARFPVFADVGSAIMQTPATAKRLLGDFLSPMYGERDKITGDITAGSKEQQKMQKLWHEDVAVNEAINKIEFWQQKNREIWDPAIETQRGPVAELLRNMTPEKRNAVLAKVAKTRIAVGVQHQAILDAFKEKNKYELAERLAARKPQLHEKSLEIADLVSTWADYSAKGETALAAQMQMEAAKLMPDPIALAKLQEHAKAMQIQRDALKQFYVDRPWFHSYSRIGEWAVDAWDKNNKQVKHAVPAKSNAEAIALEKQFRSEGLKTNIKKISRGRFVKFDEEFQSMLQNIDDTLRRSAQDYFNGELPPDKIDEFFSENSFSGTLKHFAEVQSKFKPTEDGRTLRGAEDLDVMHMELEQAGLLANSLAKTISGSKLAWAKRNPKLTTPDMAHVMKQYESAWGNYHVPDNVTVSKITKGISVYSLALNMANHMAELVQPGTTILSQATAEHGAMNSVKTLMGVLKDVAGYYTKRLGNKLSLSDEFVEWGHSGEKNMLNTLADEGMLHNGSFTDGLDPRDQGLVSLKMRARGAGQGYVGSAVQNVADSTMRLYASFNRHNARIAGLLGYRLGAASGMDHIQATDYAKRFVERAALTNTRALRPVGLFGEDTRALGQLATVMQRYNMGWLSMAARHIQRGWLLSDAQAASRGFDAESKGKARNAALMLLGSQLLAAGAVGLPFAGAMTKAYEALTGDDIKADTYQMFDKMMGEDSQSSGFFADSLIRGFANSTLSAAGIPVDMSSRFAIGGLPGMSEVSGFDAGSAFGPVGGMIKTIATGAEALAKDRDIVRAGKVLMPTGLRRLFDLAMNGDMTDNNMNRMGLSGSEKMLYGLGFTPDRIRKLRDFENMQENVTSGRRLQTDRIESQIASLMQTDPAAAQQMLHDKAKSLEISSKDLASGVAKQVEKKTLAKDFRSAIPSLDAKASMSLMRGLGTDFGEPSETKKAQLRANVMSSLGVAPDIRDMIRARRADEMLSQISRQPLAMTRQKRPSFLW